MMTDISIALKQRQDKFVETRTIIATEINKFLESLGELTEEDRNNIKMPAGRSPQEILPALWVEPFDEAAYNEQLKEFSVCVSSAISYCDKLNERALACLKSQ